MAETINPTFTVRQVLDLASLCSQFKHYPVIADCYEILFQAAMDQATPGAIKAEVELLNERTGSAGGDDYFPEYISHKEPFQL